MHTPINAGCDGRRRVVILLLMLFVPFWAQAQDFQWTTNADDTISITEYIGPGGDVVVPSDIEDKTVTVISDWSFEDYVSLTSITMGYGVTNIGQWAFFGCTGLTAFTVSESNAVYSSTNGVLFNQSQTTLIRHPEGRGGSYTIPDGVTLIENGAFSSCAGLSSVTLPDGITGIGISAFYDCTGLTDFAMGSNVTRIGQSAFSGCAGLTNITIGSGVTNLGAYTFSGCAGLTGLTIPDSVTDIPMRTFSQCTGLISVTIGSGVTNIGYDAFQNCTSLTGIAVPDGVTGIADFAFEGCAAMAGITIGAGVTDMGDSVFFGCVSLTGFAVNAGNPVYSSTNGVLFNKSQTTLIQCPEGKPGSYTIADSVTDIREWAFYRCAALTNIVIGSGVTNIGVSAFRDCSGLAGVTIGSGVINIPESAFEGCSGLSGAAIPDNVAGIGDSAFRSCSSLAGVTIGSGVTSIGTWAFHECTSLANITVSALNSVYSSLDGILFNKDQTTLILCPEGRAGTYTIPDHVVSIGASAFRECTNLTSVTISVGVTSIGDMAFAWCDSLTEVYFKGDAPATGSDVFHSIAPTVYYSPDAIGWPTVPDPWEGRPTSLWLWRPVVQRDAALGFKTNQFGFNLIAPSGMVVVVDICSDLENQTWTSLQTNTLAGDAIYFSDPQTADYSSRFYRLRSP